MTFEMKFPVHRAFDYWANAKHWNEWAEEMGEVELLTEGPTPVGTKVKQQKWHQRFYHLSESQWNATTHIWANQMDQSQQVSRNIT